MEAASANPESNKIEYVQNSWNSIIKRPVIKIREEIWIDICPKIYKWSIMPWKGTQHH